MALIKYIGTAHIREIAAADFKKLGVEGQRLLRFFRHEAVQVDDDVADTLEKELGDEFTKVKDDTSAELKSTKAEADTKPDTSSQPTNPTGHLSEDQITKPSGA